VKRYGRLLLSLFLTFGAGFVGSVFTFSNVRDWYVTLEKPLLSPPDWIFGPVWMGLYALMGVALFRVWRLAHYRKDARFWTAIFLIHLFLNALWSVLFFGLENPLIALADIVALWLILLWLVVRAWWIDRTTGWLLVPYLLWVSFATYLNFSIWFLN
jgi:translocator protein